MLVLGIESSCDDTSVALLNCSERGHFVIAEKTASQISIHKKYGGVVPEIAGRLHAEKIVPLIEEVMKQENEKTKKQKIKPDVIAVTAGPGLITGLIVGVEAARALSYAWDIPLVAVNHIEGHIHSVEIKNKNVILSETKDLQNRKKEDSSAMPQNDNFNIQYPALALVVSGGHTELILMKDRGHYEILGATKDDAAGECFDKVAKLLGLPYPGGPQISKLAEHGRVDAIDFPRPMLRENNYDFSFSGLKTSALYWLRDHTQGTFNFKLSPFTLNDFCASFEQAIVDVLVTKTLRAAEKYHPRTIILAGGVSANKKLRATLGEQIAKNLPISNFLFPVSNYCMDNAAMIAVAGYYHALKKDFTPWEKITADPNWKIS